MTEAEDKTYMRRFKKFVGEGLALDEAEDLAYNMMIRDRDVAESIIDDRRVCFECKNLDNRVCKVIVVSKKKLEPYRFILQRCEYFDLKGAK